jgi:hypothetical protein
MEAEEPPPQAPARIIHEVRSLSPNPFNPSPLVLQSFLACGCKSVGVHHTAADVNQGMSRAPYVMGRMCRMVPQRLELDVDLDERAVRGRATLWIHAPIEQVRGGSL